MVYWFYCYQKGIPKEIIKLTKPFKYNDLKGLNDLISKYKNNIACLVVEPAATTCPVYKTGQNCSGYV